MHKEGGREGQDGCEALLCPRIRTYKGRFVVQVQVGQNVLQVQSVASISALNASVRNSSHMKCCKWVRMSPVAQTDDLHTPTRRMRGRRWVATRACMTREGYRIDKVTWSKMSRRRSEIGGNAEP